MSTKLGRLRNVIVYLLSPQVLVGGFLAWIAMEGLEAYKLYRAETRADFVEVRAQILRLMIPRPRTPDDVERSIGEMMSLLSVYEGEAEHDMILRGIGSLSAFRKASLDKEMKVVAAREAERLALDTANRADGPALDAARARAAAARADVAVASIRLDWLIRDIENSTIARKRPL